MAHVLGKKVVFSQLIVGGGHKLAGLIVCAIFPGVMLQLENHNFRIWSLISAEKQRQARQWWQHRVGKILEIGFLGL